MGTGQCHDGRNDPVPTGRCGIEIRDKDGNFVSKATSDSQGKVQFDNLPILNEYTIKETKAPAGFLLNKNTYTVTYEDFLKAFDPDAQTFHVELSEAASKQTFLNIKPLYGTLDLEKINSAGNPLPFIRFQLTGLDEWNMDYDRTLVTNNSGFISVVNLLEGRYRLTEITDPNQTGFLPVDPMEFFITKDNVNIRYTKATDNPIVNDEIQVFINKLAVANNFDITQSLKDLTDFGLKKLDG